MLIARLLAFVRRDLLNATSYKAAFAYQIGTLFSSIFTVYFLSRMVAGGTVPSLDACGGDAEGAVERLLAQKDEEG